MKTKIVWNVSLASMLSVYGFSHQIEGNFTMNGTDRLSIVMDRPLNVTETIPTKGSLRNGTVDKAETHGIVNTIKIPALRLRKIVNDSLDGNNTIIGLNNATNTTTTEPMERRSITDYDLGENVLIFTSSMDMTAITKKTQEIYTKQASNDFGDERYAFLFVPNSQNGKLVPTSFNIPNINVGFYTQVLGLGLRPTDVIIDGHITSRASAGRNNVLNNFWRGIENLQITNKGALEDGSFAGRMLWGASQASPLRRLYINGHLHLSRDDWYSSGGYLSDSYIEGNIYSATQQQYFSRSSTWQIWYNAVWNMVFTGCQGSFRDMKITDQAYREDRMITIPRVPKIRQKPFLAIDGTGSLVVIRPFFESNASPGNHWDIPYETISLAEFYIAKPNASNPCYVQDMMNAMKDQKKKHILFTPGIYQFEKPLHIADEGTIILGIGLPSLVPMNGTSVLEVEDQDNITISGLIIESGPKDSAVLVKVGVNVSAETASDRPIVLHDIFILVGPRYDSYVTTAVEINTHNTIIDHTWIWRADHDAQGTFTTWKKCIADHAIVVNGNNVIIYGLFCEHFFKEQTIWNGENGMLYFYQSEIPYYVPEQWKASDTFIGYPSLKINTNVNHYQAYGLGIYTVFYKDDIMITSLITAPEKKTIQFENLVGVLINPNTNNAPGVGGASYLFNQRFPVGKTPSQGAKAIFAKGT